MGRHSIYHKLVAFTLIVCLLANDYSFAGDTRSVRKEKSDFAARALPGRTEEVFTGTNGKRILFIQDAHDSLEAQMNIARLIHRATKEQAVKTVFEEGYQGEVPVQKYFGRLKDSSAKHKVAFYYLDHLQIGAAEYAAIAGERPFRLIGADNQKAYLENVQAFADAARSEERIQADLARIDYELTELGKKHFSPIAQKWARDSEAYAAGELPLGDYLARWFDPRDKALDLKHLQAIVAISRGDDAAEPQSISAAELMQELEAFNHAMVAKHLVSDTDKDLYKRARFIKKLQALAALKLNRAGVEDLKKERSEFKTENLARWIAKAKHSPVVLSKHWESAIQNALRFYELAAVREQAVSAALKKWQTENKNENIAILIFGGFHKDGIKAILREQGFSYEIITPRISEFSDKHQKLYRRLMSAETKLSGLNVRGVQAARPAPVFITRTALDVSREVSRLLDLAGLQPNLSQREFSFRAETWLKEGRNSEASSASKKQIVNKRSEMRDFTDFFEKLAKLKPAIKDDREYFDETFEFLLQSANVGLFEYKDLAGFMHAVHLKGDNRTPIGFWQKFKLMPFIIRHPELWFAKWKDDEAHDVLIRREWAQKAIEQALNALEHGASYSYHDRKAAFNLLSEIDQLNPEQREMMAAIKPQIERARERFRTPVFFYNSLFQTRPFDESFAKLLREKIWELKADHAEVAAFFVSMDHSGKLESDMQGFIRESLWLLLKDALKIQNETLRRDRVLRILSSLAEVRVAHHYEPFLTKSKIVELELLLEHQNLNVSADAESAKRFLAELSGPQHSAGYVLLHHFEDAPLFLSAVIDDTSIDPRLRLYAYGLMISKKQSVSAVRYEALQAAAKAYLDELISERNPVDGISNRELHQILASPLGSEELKALDIAVVLDMDRIFLPDPDGMIGDHTSAEVFVRAAMGGRIHWGWDNANSQHVFGSRLRQLPIADFLTVIVHELIHGYLTKQGFVLDPSMEEEKKHLFVHAQALHEFVCDLTAITYAHFRALKPKFLMNLAEARHKEFVEGRRYFDVFDLVYRAARTQIWHLNQQFEKNNFVSENENAVRAVLWKGFLDRIHDDILTRATEGEEILFDETMSRAYQAFALWQKGKFKRDIILQPLFMGFEAARKSLRSEARTSRRDSIFSVFHSEHPQLAGLLAGFSFLMDVVAERMRFQTMALPDYWSPLNWLPDFWGTLLGVSGFICYAWMYITFQERQGRGVSIINQQRIYRAVLISIPLLFIVMEFLAPLFISEGRPGHVFTWGDINAIIAAGVMAQLIHQTKLPSSRRSEARQPNQQDRSIFQIPGWDENRFGKDPQMIVAAAEPLLQFVWGEQGTDFSNVQIRHSVWRDDLDRDLWVVTAEYDYLNQENREKYQSHSGVVLAFNRQGQLVYSGHHDIRKEYLNPPFERYLQPRVYISGQGWMRRTLALLLRSGTFNEIHSSVYGPYGMASTPAGVRALVLYFQEQADMEVLQADMDLGNFMYVIRLKNRSEAREEKLSIRSIFHSKHYWYSTGLFAFFKIADSLFLKWRAMTMGEPDYWKPLDWITSVTYPLSIANISFYLLFLWRSSFSWNEAVTQKVARGILTGVPALFFILEFVGPYIFQPGMTGHVLDPDDAAAVLLSGIILRLLHSTELPGPKARSEARQADVIDLLRDEWGDAKLKEGVRILDAGASEPGFLIRFGKIARDRGVTSQLFAADKDAQLRGRFKKAGISLFEGFVEEMHKKAEWKDKTFDLITVNAPSGFSPQAFAALAAKLSPEGMMIIRYLKKDRMYQNMDMRPTVPFLAANGFAVFHQPEFEFDKEILPAGTNPYFQDLGAPVIFKRGVFKSPLLSARSEMRRIEIPRTMNGVSYALQQRLESKPQDRTVFVGMLGRFISKRAVLNLGPGEKDTDIEMLRQQGHTAAYAMDAAFLENAPDYHIRQTFHEPWPFKDGKLTLIYGFLSLGGEVPEIYPEFWKGNTAENYRKIAEELARTLNADGIAYFKVGFSENPELRDAMIKAGLFVEFDRDKTRWYVSHRPIDQVLSSWISVMKEESSNDAMATLDQMLLEQGRERATRVSHSSPGVAGALPNEAVARSEMRIAREDIHVNRIGTEIEIVLGSAEKAQNIIFELDFRDKPYTSAATDDKTIFTATPLGGGAAAIRSVTFIRGKAEEKSEWYDLMNIHRRRPLNGWVQSTSGENQPMSADDFKRVLLEFGEFENSTAQVLYEALVAKESLERGETDENHSKSKHDYLLSIQYEEITHHLLNESYRKNILDKLLRYRNSTALNAKLFIEQAREQYLSYLNARLRDLENQKKYLQDNRPSRRSAFWEGVQGLLLASAVGLLTHVAVFLILVARVIYLTIKATIKQFDQKLYFELAQEHFEAVIKATELEIQRQKKRARSEMRNEKEEQGLARAAAGLDDFVNKIFDEAKRRSAADDEWLERLHRLIEKNKKYEAAAHAVIRQFVAQPLLAVEQQPIVVFKQRLFEKYAERYLKPQGMERRSFLKAAAAFIFAPQITGGALTEAAQAVAAPAKSYILKFDPAAALTQAGQSLGRTLGQELSQFAPIFKGALQGLWQKEETLWIPELRTGADQLLMGEALHTVPGALSSSGMPAANYPDLVHGQLLAKKALEEPAMQAVIEQTKLLNQVYRGLSPDAQKAMNSELSEIAQMKSPVSAEDVARLRQRAEELENLGPARKLTEFLPADFNHEMAMPRNVYLLAEPKTKEDEPELVLLTQGSDPRRGDSEFASYEVYSIPLSLIDQSRPERKIKDQIRRMTFLNPFGNPSRRGYVFMRVNDQIEPHEPLSIMNSYLSSIDGNISERELWIEPSIERWFELWKKSFSQIKRPVDFDVLLMYWHEALKQTDEVVKPLREKWPVDLPPIESVYDAVLYYKMVQPEVLLAATDYEVRIAMPALARLLGWEDMAREIEVDLEELEKRIRDSHTAHKKGRLYEEPIPSYGASSELDPANPYGFWGGSDPLDEFEAQFGDGSENRSEMREVVAAQIKAAVLLSFADDPVENFKVRMEAQAVTRVLASIEPQFLISFFWPPRKRKKSKL